MTREPEVFETHLFPAPSTRTELLGFIGIGVAVAVTGWPGVVGGRAFDDQRRCGMNHDAERPLQQGEHDERVGPSPRRGWTHRRAPTSRCAADRDRLPVGGDDPRLPAHFGEDPARRVGQEGVGIIQAQTARTCVIDDPAVSGQPQRGKRRPSRSRRPGDHGFGKPQ